MIRSMIWMGLVTLLFAVGCSGEDTDKVTKPMEDAAKAAGASAEKMAHDMAGHADTMAGNMADNMADNANEMAGQAGNAAADMADSAAAMGSGSVVDSCRSLAEQGAWGQALEVCKKAHEMMPDDLALEHAYQQAQAAAK